MNTQTLFEGEERTPLEIRGLHIDIARHFIQVETVLRIIDKMAQLRLNTLHLHLSDDQGFPVQFERYPMVQSDPQWSIADQERIAAACREHGIQVIPEIDIPGHARAFLSFFDPDIQPEKKLGLITTEYIEMERDLPVVLDMFDELVERFGATMIHMGGDEAANYERFPELIQRVCDWAAERKLEVVAWDDVLDAIDDIPENLIIQRWRRRNVSPKIAEARTIQSWGYYLDRVYGPFYSYKVDPHTWQKNMGCIACMWTELVTDETIECTIFPSLYMMAHRWWTFPKVEKDVPTLLRKLCERYGYPKAAFDDWRIRRWVGFYRDDPRSTSSVTVDDVLDREQDLFPVFSPSLVIIADALYRHFMYDQTPTEEEKALLASLGQAAYQDDLSFLLERAPDWRPRLEKLLQTPRDSKLYNNGLKATLKLLLDMPMQLGLGLS